MRKCDGLQNAVTLTPRQLASLRRNLLTWYRANRRDHPWRREPTPYRVWIAEIMLQQTRIAAVLPYYERFLSRFPEVRVLARAREAEVLKYWAGLGYYSRARNLQSAARKIMREHGGKFPSKLEEALALPGIGPYTAAAILSIAYKASLAVVDGNVARVLARLFAIRGNLRAPKRWKRLGAAAHRLLPPQFAGDWNQAVMELGETTCTPRSPQCGQCPIARHCKAHTLGLERKLPAARQKRATAHIRVAAAILLDPRGRALVTRTPGFHDDVLFSRMWQFPAIAVATKGCAASDALSAHLKRTFHFTPVLVPLPPASHTVTYRKVSLLPFLARVPVLPHSVDCRAIALENLASIPVSSATQKIARAALAGIPQGTQ